MLAAAVRACEFALDIVEVKLLGGQLLPGALCGVAKVALIRGIAGEATKPLPDCARGVPDSGEVSFAYGRYFFQRHDLDAASCSRNLLSHSIHPRARRWHPCLHLKILPAR